MQNYYYDFTYVFSSNEFCWTRMRTYLYMYVFLPLVVLSCRRIIWIPIFVRFRWQTYTPMLYGHQTSLPCFCSFSHILASLLWKSCSTYYHWTCNAIQTKMTLNDIIMLKRRNNANGVSFFSLCILDHECTHTWQLGWMIECKLTKSPGRMHCTALSWWTRAHSVAI